MNIKDKAIVALGMWVEQGVHPDRRATKIQHEVHWGGKSLERIVQEIGGDGDVFWKAMNTPMAEVPEYHGNRNPNRARL